MGFVQNGVLFLQFLMVCYFIILAIYHSHSSKETAVTVPGSQEGGVKNSILVNRGNVGVQSLLDLIHNQNDTIHKLGALLESIHQSKEELLMDKHNTINRETLSHHDHIQDKEVEMKSMEAEIAKLTQMTSSLSKELATARSQQASSSSSSGSSGGYGSAMHKEQPSCPPCPTCRHVSGYSTSTPIVVNNNKADWANGGLSSVEQQCEGQYGLSLINEWRKSEQVWCHDDFSNLKCYPYHQHHKKRSGQGKDVFCVATNFVIDFSKVHGDPAVHSHVGQAKLSNYLSFDPGSLTASCRKTVQYKSTPFMPHQNLQFSTFQDNHNDAGHDHHYTVEETPTYLLARDEDCENSFHSTADFMNVFLVSNILKQDPGAQQVLLWDKHHDGPYHELIEKAYSGAHKPRRHHDYNRQKVMFKKLVFHLESPAGLIFPKVSRPGQLRCTHTGLFKGYSEYILKSFNLWKIEAPPVPHITVIVRNRTPSKNVGRIMANKDEVENVIKEGNLLSYDIVDTAKLPFSKQLELVRRTNILVGVHGAGLMLILFAAKESVLIEVHPTYRQDRHFRHASRMVGHTYMPLRAVKRETCIGSSDNVEIPIQDFRRTLDGAMRIARNTDEGISECGLVCPVEVLALDERLVKGYFDKYHIPKNKKANTRFPC